MKRVVEAPASWVPAQTRANWGLGAPLPSTILTYNPIGKDHEFLVRAAAPANRVLASV